MRLVKMFGLAALAAVAAMAFVGATSASAEFDTVLCKEHGEGLTKAQLLCPKGQESTLTHLTLLEGTVAKLLLPLFTILCLGVLIEGTPLGLAVAPNQHEVHTLASSYTGCGSSASHSSCTATVEEQPLGSLLKAGLDFGTLELLSGRVRLQCSNLGIDCKYDAAGTLFEAGAGMITAEKTPTTELGGKFFCPDEGQLDWLLLNLEKDPAYILQ